MQGPGWNVTSGIFSCVIMGKKKETDLLTGIEITSLVAGISCGTHNAATPTVIEIEIGVDTVMTARGLI